MAYTVDFTNGTKTAITVANSAVDTTTNIGLVGRGYKGYGEVVAENMLHLLENFASGSAPSKPVEGQIWFDSASNSLRYFDNTVANSGNWKSIANMAVQSNAPTSVGETDGHFWLDSDTGLLYIYYNGSWISFSDVAGDSRIVARTRNATNGFQYRTIETIVNGKIVSIQSSDDIGATGWTPQNDGGADTEYLENGVTVLSSEFPLVRQGINLNTAGDYVFSGTATKALYADLAERYASDAEYSYGTVVKIGGTKEITQTDTEYCTDVFGVISDKPAFGMNDGAGTKKTHPYVALAGRIPVKVIGKVNKGDRLVASSVPGHAMAGVLDRASVYTVIGRALENKINDEAGVVEAVVGTK